MKITLHHVPLSRSFRVIWMLEELGLDYDLIQYSIRDGSLRDPEFLRLSPAGRVPALEFGGEVLFESGAILQTLSERYPQAGLGRDAGAPTRARFLEFLAYGETMAGLIEFLNMQHLFLRDPMQASATVIKLTTGRLRATLKGMEVMLAEVPAGQEYLLADGFSAADVMMGFNLLAAPYYVHLDEFENLSAYAARIVARPAFERAMARDGVQEFYTQDFYPVPEG